MAELQSKEGRADFSVPLAEKPCKTWYRIFGDLNSGQTPLICLHGGPGFPHQYLTPISSLATKAGIPVVFYDQIGCGNSTRLPERNGDTKFWTTEMFLDELDNLLENLGIHDNYDLFGHSWGGMVGAAHAIRQPKGLRRLVLADTPLDIGNLMNALEKLKSGLPHDVQGSMRKHEKEGTTDSEEYHAAMEMFFDRHLCRLKPIPEELETAFRISMEDNSVYQTMWGASEFFVTGSLKDFNVTGDAHKIIAPTLLLNGQYDEIQDDVIEPIFEVIPNVKWVKFEESSHMPHLEEKEKFMKVLSEFLLLE